MDNIGIRGDNRLSLYVQQYYKLQELAKSTEANFITLFASFGVISAALGFAGDFLFVYDFNLVFWIIPFVMLAGLWAYCLRSKKIVIINGYLTALEKSTNEMVRDNVLVWNTHLLSGEYFKKYWVHKAAVPLFGTAIMSIMIFCLTQSFLAESRFIYYTGFAISIFCSVLCMVFFAEIHKLVKESSQNAYHEKALQLMSETDEWRDSEFYVNIIKKEQTAFPRKGRYRVRIRIKDAMETI
ncbi:MAG: hypothetical protein FWC73_14125 [Defluviitaleaceae bacterium]|nr:hypothetical protein [Defluviitaleaceae bacterium]